MSAEKAEKWVCGDCGHRPLGRGRPTGNTCPACRGDFTWRPGSDNQEVDDE